MGITKRIKVEYEYKLKDIGEDGLLREFVENGIAARRNFSYPETEMLQQAESLARTRKANLLIIGRPLWRAAHKVYRQGKREISNYPVNSLFLDIAI